MSTEVERIKKLVEKDLLVDAIEVPTNHHKDKAIVIDDLEEALARFDDDDADYAHFVIRVKRNTVPLPKPLAEPQPPQLSIDTLVNETLELSERITESRMQQGEESISVESDEAGKDADYEPGFLLENAKLLEESGDTTLARNIYQALIRKGAMIPEGLAGLARTYEKDGEIEKAARCYQEAIAYSSELQYYQALAAIHIRAGNDLEASQTLLYALGLPNLNDSQKFELHKSLGNCFTRTGDYEKAEHHYRKAYELNASSDILQVNVGSLALQKNDLDAAQKHFQKALELNSRNDRAISGMGMVHMARNKMDEAHKCFVASLKLNLNNLGTIYNLVKCAYELKKFSDAAELLKKYIETHPVNTNILYSYAGILFHQGEYRQAMSEVSKIIDSHPNHAGAKELQELIQAKLV